MNLRDLLAYIPAILSLLSLPREPWNDVLVNWLGNLREAICVDCASSLSEFNNQLRTVFDQQTFRFTCDAFNESNINVLDKILNEVAKSLLT